MRISRIFTPQALQSGQILVLESAPSRHLRKVLRLPVGAELTLFNGDGGEWPATLTGDVDGCAECTLGEHRVVSCESPLAVTLVQGISRGERMDYTLQKAVELGVTAVQPIFSQRTVVKLSGERLNKRTEHWRGVLIAACEQSGRNCIPDLRPAVSLSHFLAMPTVAERRLLLNPLAGAGLSAHAKPQGEIELLIGPEGGLSNAEIATAEHAGFTGIQLGPRVLRTETAGMAALAALQTLWGDFN